MAPKTPSKRQRGKSSGFSPSIRAFDKQKFVSTNTTDKYDYLVPKALTLERGLVPNSFDGQMHRQIHEQVWEILIDDPDLAIVNVVKEFYANVKDMAPFMEFVRGKHVLFSAEAINEYYNLRAPVVCQYVQLIDSNPNYDQIWQKYQNWA